ncbi:MAG: fimbrillin family protein [Alistipes sp.]|uniref:fimbrillin family protein n=1 Tax=Alistipes sp. TaxID=1872444 RepID=UPI0025BA9B9D|nr:fimbrillin family protein [Alistipes sp.]MCD8275962.1 fimbrillin family protein [Alistipes sp.]
MKRNARHLLRNLAAAIIACAGFTACSQDGLTDGTPLEEKTPLELTASHLYEAVATPQTRGTIDGNWEGAKTVAVRVNEKIKEYTATTGTDGKTMLTCNDITEADTEFWWTKNGESKTVDAWYPYSEGQPEEWKVSSPQTAESLVKEDLMCASSTVVTQTGSTIKFEHMLAKVVINLICNSDYLEKASKVEVSLTRQYQTGTLTNYGSVWNFSGKIGDSPNYTITAYESSPRATYQALVIPLSQGNPSIVINVDGAKYSYTIKGVGSIFSGGNQYTFNITVKEEGLEVTVEENIGWEEGNTGSGTVEID